MVVGSHDKMRQLPLLTGERRYRDDAFAASAGIKIVPKLDPGDAIIFDHFTLHRTQPQISEIFERTSCEFRFIKLSGWRKLLAMTSCNGLLHFLPKINELNSFCDRQLS